MDNGAGALNRIKAFADPDSPFYVWAVRQVIVVLLVSLALEALVFNFPFYMTSLSGASEQVLAHDVTVSAGDKLSYDVDGVSLSSISIKLSDKGDMTVPATVSIADSGHTRTTYALPALTIYGTEPVVVPAFSYGTLRQVDLSFDLPEGATCKVDNFSINAVAPFKVSKKRIALAFGILLLWAFVRPKSRLWGMKVGDYPQLAKVVTVGLVALVGAAMFFSLGWSYDDGPYEGYTRFAHDEYQQLARALPKGRLDIEEEPPSWIESLDGLKSPGRLEGDSNLYDPTVRAEMEASTGELFKIDCAYANGHYYVYFGVVPVILAYLPYHLITGGDLLNSWACLAALAGALVGMAFFVCYLCRKRFPKAPIAACALALLGGVCLSSAVYTVAVPSFYNVPVSFGLMFATFALALGTVSYYQTSMGKKLCATALSSLCLALIAGCRPQLLVVAVPLGYLVVKDVRRMLAESPRQVAYFACACLVPLVAVGSALAAYNAARFGSPFDFGANYNLTGNDMTVRGKQPLRAIEGLFMYMFYLPLVDLVFPFMHVGVPASTVFGLTIAEPLPCGIFASAPCLIFVVLSALYSKRWHIGRIAAVGSLVLMVFVAAFDAEGAGILGRYAQDFGLIAGVGFIVCLLHWADEGKHASRMQVGGVCLLMLVSVFALVLMRLGLMDEGSRPTGFVPGPDVLEAYRNIFSFWIK